MKAVKKQKAAAAPPAARPAPKVAFPKKAQAPTHAEFAARLPAPVGKRFEAVRAYLKMVVVTPCRRRIMRLLRRLMLVAGARDRNSRPCG